MLTFVKIMLQHIFVW